LREAPTSDKKIYVDASQPATLNNSGVLDDCPTLRKPVTTWRRLKPEQKKRATIKVFGGPLYSATETKRLRYRLKRRS
jgi:hypothetical protein